MHEIPTIGADDISRLLRAELSFKARARYLVGFLATTTFATALLSLWLTEPGLPARTHVAFGVLVTVNVSWAAFCLWALTRRKVLYARQRIVAGRLAVLWSAVFVVGALMAAAISRNAMAGYAAAAFGSLFLAGAVAALRSAKARHRQLLQLRETLESM